MGAFSDTYSNQLYIKRGATYRHFRGVIYNKMNRMNNPEPEPDPSVSKVWPPPPTNFPETRSYPRPHLQPEPSLRLLPPPRIKKQGTVAASILVITGAIIGFGLAACGIPPFMKGYTSWSELAPFFCWFLAGFLGNSARKEQIPLIRAILWLTCGSVGAWATIAFLVQGGAP